VPVWFVASADPAVWRRPIEQGSSRVSAPQFSSTSYLRGRLAALVAFLGLMVVLLPAVAMPPDRLEIATAKGATHAFTVEIVDTPELRAQGLMFRTRMDPDHGMLFDFKREEPVWFWMKNTYLPLDMIFVKADGTILSVAENTTPLSEATVPSGGAVRFVFEVVAGTAKRLGIARGDRLLHPRMQRSQ